MLGGSRLSSAKSAGNPQRNRGNTPGGPSAKLSIINRSPFNRHQVHVCLPSVRNMANVGFHHALQGYHGTPATAPTCGTAPGPSIMSCRTTFPASVAYPAKASWRVDRIVAEMRSERGSISTNLSKVNRSIKNVLPGATREYPSDNILVNCSGECRLSRSV